MVLPGRQSNGEMETGGRVMDNYVLGMLVHMFRVKNPISSVTHKKKSSNYEAKHYATHPPSGSANQMKESMGNYIKQ